MKRILVIAGLMTSAFIASAQNYYKDSGNPETLVSADYQVSTRKEIVLPQVNGYNVYKADLHTHSVFSDGQVNSTFRVNEAWLDGLDIMAVTEHIEYRSFEDMMVRYTKNYHKGKYEKADACYLQMRIGERKHQCRESAAAAEISHTFSGGNL